MKLTAGQTVYITGLPTGTAYTVAEENTGYYTASITGATGTVTAHTITAVDVTNVPRIHNDLIVSKTVRHPQWMTDITALEEQEFTIAVTVTGADANTAYQTSVAGLIFTTDASGAATQTVTLKDGQSMTVYDLPAGTGYSVAEVDVPQGHTANATENAPITGTVPAEGDALAAVVNTYAPGAANTTVTLAGTKTFLTSGGYTVPDSDWPDEGFTVELYRVDAATGADTLVKGDIQVTAANKSWSVDVPMTFDKTGTYFYRIVEKAGQRDDIVYDSTEGLFKVVVTDDASGTLKVSQIAAVQDTTTVDDTTVTKSFTNYKDAGIVRVPVKKIITGTNAISDKEFLFGLFDEQGNLLDTVTGSGEFVIAGYGEDFDTPRTYTVKELIPVVEDRIVGMTYDDMVYTVTVQWVDGTGMTATVAGLPQGETGPVFTNTYQETVSYPAIGLGGAKTVTGDRTAIAEGETFTFHLYKTDASFDVAAGEPVVTDTVNSADNAFAFDGLTFKEAGVYYYVVKEADEGRSGVTYDAAEYHVTIHVVKEADRSGATVLRAAATVHKLGTNDDVAADQLNFTNTYTVTGQTEVTLTGTKELTGRELIAGEFAFGLYHGDDLLQSVTNTAGGKFAFAPITYTAEDIGTHTYTVKEIVPAEKLGGVIYDSTVYTVDVTVSDDGQGGLTAAKTVSGNGELAFTNTYAASFASAVIRGSKTLYDVDADKNLALTNGQFSFELYESDKDFAQQGSLIGTVTNSADGSFSFTGRYTRTGDYYYILREAIGDAAGVSYDAGRYLIHVVVTDDGAGKLHATVSMVRDGVGSAEVAHFGNRYDPEATTAQISGTKKLTGRDLVDGEFTFYLYENGEKIGEAVNKNGIFTFDAIIYEAPGTYTYTVREHNPATSGNTYKSIIYDTDVETVTVTVVDNSGKLEATVSHTAQQLVFENTYEQPKTPNTGDNFQLIPVILAMVLSAMGMAAVLVLKKKTA